MLMDTLFKAHAASALRGNCSHQALVISTVGSGDYFKAIAAALLSCGGLHAPLVQTYDLLTHEAYRERVRDALATGNRVPGWGSHFHQGVPDPIWADCDAQLRQEHPAIADRIRAITELLSVKALHPNPSCYTAACAIAMQIPRWEIGALLLRGRLTAWTSEYARIMMEAPRLL